MGEVLNVVIVSESEEDADLITRSLTDAGFFPSARRVCTREELSRAIGEGTIEAVLVCGGPAWLKASSAIGQMRDALPDIPLIFVSEPIGEEGAIEILKAGAHDIVHKGQLGLLGSVIERELKEAKARRENRRIQKAVQTVANEWRMAVDTVISPLCFIDIDGKIRRCNRALQRLSGKPFIDIIGARYIDVLRGIDPSQDYDTLSGAVSVQGGRDRTLRLRDRVFESDYQPAMDDTYGLTGYVFILHDITERKRAEAEASRLEGLLAQAQKMEAVGQLAGGVAHDFNNIVTGIMGYCSILLMRLPAEDPLRSFVSRILSASQHAAEITQGLLTFGKRQTFNPRYVDLNSLISGNKEFMDRVTGEEIEIRLELCPDELPVFADPIQIEQILLNLSTNARDAMPHGGVIGVSSSVDGTDSKRPFGRFSFSDTGTGIETEIQKRIFEPFFTTKEIGKGTGLGLSVAWSIIEQHGGHISVESVVGKGTTFTVSLPLVKRKAETTAAGKQTAGVGGTETILLVEDDGTVRDTVRTALESYGYTVISAVDGEDALKQFRKNIQAISLVILDIIIPKRDGIRTYEEMRALNPGLKRLFISGYADDVLGGKGVDFGSREFMRKPFPPLDLTAKVREILDGQQ